MKITTAWLNEHTNSYAISLNRKQAKLLGLKFPLQRGWVQRLVGKELDTETAALFEAARFRRGDTSTDDVKPVVRTVPAWRRGNGETDADDDRLPWE